MPAGLVMPQTIIAPKRNVYINTPAGPNAPADPNNPAGPATPAAAAPVAPTTSAANTNQPTPPTPAATPENAAPPAPEATTAPEAAEAHAAAAPVQPAPIIELQSQFSRMAEIASGSADRIKQQAKREKKEESEINGALEAANKEMLAAAAAEKDSKKRTREILQKLIQQKKITQVEAQEFMDLDARDPKFESQWQQLTHELTTTATREDLHTIKAEAYAAVKLQDDCFNKIKAVHEAMAEAEKHINLKVSRERTLAQHSRDIGFDIKVGKEVRFKTYRTILLPDGKVKKEPIYRRAIIRDVFFDDIDIVDAKGKEKKLPSLEPTISLQYTDEWRDAEGNQNGGVEQLSAAALKRMADNQEMCEIIEDRQDTDDTSEELEQLKQILGQEIKEGDIFEYLDIGTDESGNHKHENRSVQIVSIYKAEDPFFNEENSQRKGHKVTMISLSEPVVVATNPSLIQKKELTLGEFAKWKKRVEAQKPIDLKELRTQLTQENKDRNSRYKRKAKQYPPIKAETGEVLYADTDPQKTFLIQDVNDETGQITLDNGGIYTPANFLAWVKRNEIEKKDADAEAEKKTAGLEDDNPNKQKILQEAKDKVEEELNKRRNPPPNLLKDDDNVVQPPGGSYIRQLWNDTYFMSGGNLYALGKEIIDFIKRWMERREKNTIGAVGNAMLTPIWGQMGAEFKALQQQAENERVQRFMDSYEQYGYGDLYGQLQKTSNRDELKALFKAMSAKGWIRWNDPVLWAAMSRVGRKKDASYFVNTYDEEKFREILDAFWGDGSYADFRSQNDSAYNSEKGKIVEYAKKLENDPSQMGGVKARLQTMLAKHMRGEYVPAEQYEGYIHFAIQYGKLTFADKVYFILMGLGAEGPAGGDYPGRTILDFGRVSSFGTELLGNYPIIDYFAAPGANLIQRDKNGEIKKDRATGEPMRGQMSQNIVKYIINKYIEKDAKTSIYNLKNPGQFNAGDSLINFIETEIMSNEGVCVRMDKASRDISMWDHEDFHMNAPQLKENQIEQITKEAGGNQKSSVPGIRNAISGLNHFIRLDLDQYMRDMKKGKAGEADQHLVSSMDRMLAFIRLHAVLDNRCRHGIHDRIRLGRELKQCSGVDSSRFVSDQIDEMNGFMNGLIGEMIKVDPASFKRISEEWNLLRNPVNFRQQKKQEEIALRFSTTLSDAMARLKEKVGNNGVFDIVRKIQGEGSANEQLIKGIQARVLTKEEIQEQSTKKASFERMQMSDVRDNVETLERLRLQMQTRGQLTPEKMQEEREVRLSTIINNVKQGKYGMITDSDKALLEKEIANLQRQVGDRGDEEEPA